MPVLRFAARRAFGGVIAKRSDCLASEARQIECRWSRKLAGRWKHKHDTGSNRQASSDVVPHSSPERRCKQSISRSGRCRRHSVGPDCQWTL
jgi:hypothetical protein